MGNEEFNSTQIAKQIFSCIYKVNQRFGVNYIASILIGSKSAKVLRYKHDQIPSFGALKEYSFGQVRVFIEELTSQGFLLKTPDLYPVLKLMGKAEEVKSSKVSITLSPLDPALARKSGLGRGESVIKTMELFKQGRSIVEIAQERNLAQSTILSHLADAYQQGEKLDIDRFVPADRQAMIVKAFKKLGTDYLSPVRQDLGQSFSWEDLKWVRAKLLRQEQAAA